MGSNAAYRHARVPAYRKILPASAVLRTALPAPLVGAELPPADEIGNAARAVGAFEFVARLNTMQDPAVIRHAFAQELQKYGITNFAMMENASWRAAAAHNVLDDRMPGEWKHRYFEQKYESIDPVVVEAKTSPRPFLWSECLEKYNTKEQCRRIFEEAADFALNEGLCIPIYGPQRYMAWVTLAGAQLDLDPMACALIHFMALYTHNHLAKLAQNPSPPHTELTLREKECLRWAAQGKSDWEIGEILTISERTAHWYIESAKRKIGVATRIQAVVTAISEGLIQI